MVSMHSKPALNSNFNDTFSPRRTQSFSLAGFIRRQYHILVYNFDALSAWIIEENERRVTALIPAIVRLQKEEKRRNGKNTLNHLHVAWKADASQSQSHR